MARILHYLDTDTFAGTEAHVLTLLRSLTVCGETCGLLCREGTEFARHARQLPGVTVFAMPPLPLPHALRRLACCVAAWKPDLLHAHNGRTALQCAWLSGQRVGGNRLRSLATQHFVAPAHTHYHGLKRVVADRMHGWVNARLARIIAVSEAVRRSALAREPLAPGKVVTIYNGIDPPQAEAERARAALGDIGPGPLLITVGRLSAEKGHRYLLTAAPEILRQYPGARLLWLGAGPEEAALRAEVERARLQNSIWMPGHRADAADFLALADLKILPSLHESFGLSLVEAMMLGTPVLATDCGGPGEVIAPAFPAAEATGWLVPKADADALAVAVCQAFGDSARREQIGRRGRKRALEQFLAPRMAARTAALYAEALSSGG